MPVPALFRYRKRVLLGRSSEGPHQVVRDRQPRSRSPAGSIDLTFRSRDHRIRGCVNRAWIWPMAVELLLLLLLPSSRSLEEPLVFRVLRALVFEGSCSSSPSVFPCQRL